MCSPEVRDWVTTRLTWDMCNCVTVSHTVACSLRSISSESQLFVLVSRDGVRPQFYIELVTGNASTHPGTNSS